MAFIDVVTVDVKALRNARMTTTMTVTATSTVFTVTAITVPAMTATPQGKTFNYGVIWINRAFMGKYYANPTSTAVVPKTHVTKTLTKHAPNVGGVINYASVIIIKCSVIKPFLLYYVLHTKSLVTLSMSCCCS